jgi:adenosylcobinamide-phosphate synthase
MFAFAWYMVAGFALDYLLADPQYSLHPVRIMGRAVTRAERVFRNLSLSPFRAGLLFALSLILGAWIVAALLVLAAAAVSPVLAGAVNIVLIYFCVSARSLEKEALAIRKSLVAGRLEDARNTLAMIVGRDVDPLDESGVSRAAVETVAENLVDGVISPLFFAAVGGAPLAVAFKMASTLDSMVGYKDEEYLYFGKAAARIDDIANFIPARISVFVISLAAFLLFRSGSTALSVARRDRRRHSSPNAGYPEAAFAGALSVQLGGPNYYQGELVDKPYIGEDLGRARPLHIEKACRLMMLSSVLFLALASAAIMIWAITRIAPVSCPAFFRTMTTIPFPRGKIILD